MMHRMTNTITNRTSRQMLIKCRLLLSLLGLECALVGAISITDLGGGTNDNSTASSNINIMIDDPRHHRGVGGLYWRDLGVSLLDCPWTTAQMLDKKYDNDDVSRDCVAMDDGRKRKWHCMEDSTWLLHPSSGFVENGSLCGILGPSGAGKTTLLNALGGTTPRSSGVFLTGTVWYEMVSLDNISQAANSTNTTSSSSHVRYHLSQQEGDIAMLSQHDDFFDMLTPRESLEFAAYLESQKKSTRKDGSEKQNDPKAIAERQLSSLGLLGVADRRIGDRTKMDGGGHGTSRPWMRKLLKMRGGGGGGGGGGLSGGERRRLSLALELVTEPKLFLADEPTTGLDSSQAEKVIKLIASLAKEQNVPSICTLHQPKTSIWKTLDRFILLAPGGKMCYAGDTDKATTYFKDIGYECPHDTNPAEFFIDLVTVDTEDPVQAIADEARINLLHHHFLHSCTTDDAWSLFPDKHDMAIMKQQPPQTDARRTVVGNLFSVSSFVRNKLKGIGNACKRFAFLLLRSWRQNIRNTNIILLRLGASIVQASLFATIFKSVRNDKPIPKSIADRVALLTYGVINISIMSLMKTLDLFARERGVVMREQMRCNYFSLEYILAKVVAEIPIDTSFSLVFAAVLKLLTGLRTSMATLIKTYCLMTMTSACLGFAIGSFTSTVQSAMSTGLSIMVIFMVVGIINPSGVNSEDPPNWVMDRLAFFSPIKWAIESLVTAEFRGMVFDEKDRGLWGQLKDLPKMGALALVQDGDSILANLGLGNAKYSDLMMKLWVLSGIYITISWLGLSYFGPSFMDTKANF